MATTTQIIVVCPSCGEEVTLPFCRVDVEVKDTIASGDGKVLPISLSADAWATGAHQCQVK